MFKTLLLDPVLNQWNPVHTFTPYSSKISFNPLYSRLKLPAYNKIYCDMTLESCNIPVLANGSLAHVSMTTSQYNLFSEQQFGKHVPMATNKQKRKTITEKL